MNRSDKVCLFLWVLLKAIWGLLKVTVVVVLVVLAATLVICFPGVGVLAIIAILLFGHTISRR